MTKRRLLLETLAFFWRSHLVLTLCVATGTAVLTGAIIVGDSMKASLREITLDRLGRVDYALHANRLFRESLADQLQEVLPGHLRYRPGQSGSPLRIPVEPALQVRASATRVDEMGNEFERVSRVQVWGVRDSFASLARNRRETAIFQDLFRDGSGQDAVIISQSLARELAVSVGENIILRVETPSDVPREAVLGRKADTIRILRLKISSIAESSQLGRFGLEPTQIEPRNAFVSLEVLQSTLGQAARANTLLVTEPPEVTDTPRQSAESMQRAIAECWSLDDVGLRLHLDRPRQYLSLESSRMVLDAVAAEAARRVAESRKLPYAPTLAYLANSIDRVSDSGEIVRSIPYSIVAAMPLSESNGSPFGGLKLEAGSLPGGDDDILLNQWAADDLEIQIGDRVRLSYFVAEPDEPFETAETIFRVSGIVALEGAAADPGLVPEYPGITDAKRYADWDPPFPVDLRRVRPKDEEYWEKYRTTPKAFLALGTGERLWGSRFGDWTSIRVAAQFTARGAQHEHSRPAPDEQQQNSGPPLEEVERDFASEMLADLRPEQFGLIFQPVKAQGLEASRGGTDFGQLFLAFSFFLIVSAALLIGLVFRLGIDRRLRQVGLLLALGFDHVTVRSLLILEGCIVTLAGTLLGIGGAIGYGWFVMAALRTWWRPAVGTTLLELHVEASTLAIGLLAGALLAMIAMVWAIRGLVRTSPRALLAGSTSELYGKQVGGHRARWSRITGWLALTLSFALFGSALIWSDSPALFFGVGAALLWAFLSFLAVHLSRDSVGLVRGGDTWAVARLGVRNAGRHRGRSVLTATLVASATFVIVAVTVHRRHSNGSSHDGSVAGFSLVAQCDVPLLHDLGTLQGRAELGVPDEVSRQLSGMRVFSFRAKEGEDASCLNLYQPTQPRVLGATAAMIERNGFRTASSQAETAEEQENVWRLLDRDLGEDVVPVLGDANSVRWILKLGLGERLAMTVEDGRTIEFQIVALLHQSVFQSELVISEANFRKLYPSLAGYSYFLIEQPEEANVRIQPLLEANLAEFGFDAVPVSQRLAEYHAVENTYLSTFQLLGGLGLVLGTFGLGAVLWRGVLERRGELALLLAVGFRTRSLVGLVWAENMFLLIAGLVAGTLSAFVAAAPHLLKHATELPWPSLLGTLLVVLLAGVVASAAGVIATLRTPLLPSLRSE